MNLAYLLDRAADETPERAAMVGRDLHVTWGQLRERVRRLAGALWGFGIADGDRVAMLSGNDPRCLEIHLALAWMGAVIVPLNTRLSEADLGFELHDSGARFAFVGDRWVETAEAIAPTLPRAVLRSREAGGRGRDSFEEFLVSARPMRNFATVAPDSTLGIFYTGGTTGVPKGVMLSHQNMLANATIMTGGLGYTAEDVHLHASPMFHVGDVGCVWAALFAGGAHAFLPVFTPGGFVGAVARARVTTTMLAPSMITLLVRSGALEAADLSSWTTLLYGGSSITVDTLRRALADLPCRLFQSYGLAEATQGVCLLRPEEHVRARSCGRPMLGVQVRVADVRLDAVAPGEPGEIVVRGPTVMKGYWRRSLETAEALRGGWLRTGDLATVDEDGFVYLLDRQRDMIISGGENVYSAEVENALSSHPVVADCAVIGVPDPMWGERVHAIVVAAPGAAIVEAELALHCRRLIGGYKVPRSFEVRDELPRTAAGTVPKGVLREPYWRGKTREIH